MTWVVPLALGGFAILLMAVFTVFSARKRHRASQSPASVGPRVLIHDINDDRCTGCDACVAVCPTNVLDLVSNKSRVLRFHDCIQCEACMFACPTEALVMFPEGATPPALKVPEIDENFQTAVPGQYLIGEVAGKPLVKNAANLGRTVVEHMLAGGMAPGALGGGETSFDVVIVGSGPGGLSAALTCIQKGLSYVVLDKEQVIASTISRYPKGKLVMAEPYDATNLSLLPVFDSAKEQLIPIWREVIERVGMQIKLGESVETVARGKDGVFDVRTTVAAYRAQRVVLSIGTRGKPRTLQVPGENLPKVFSLLEDPDDWRGRSVLIVGGGDSACEAALALADAGAKVMISYRGKGFNRAAPKNKQAIESYASQGKVKAKLGSQVLAFEADSVSLALADGSQKRYANDGAFVLIGADPPIAWLEKMGVRFVERPHQYQLGKTDEVLRRFVPRAIECPEDAARAAAQVLGGSIGIEPPRPQVDSMPAVHQVSLPMPMGEPVSGPRKWLRSATSIFSTNRHGTQSGVNPLPQAQVQAPANLPAAGSPARPESVRRAKKFDAPVPLSEFAKRGKTNIHSHNGRRDALSAGERTRILRMLRDEGGRMADEDSQVYIGAAPAGDYDFDFNDSPAPAPMPLRPDVPAKPAVVVGLAQAQAAAAAARTGNKKPAAPPRATAQQFAAPVPPPPPPRSHPPSQPPPPPPRSRQRESAASPPPPPPRRQVPVAAFGDEPTRQVDDALLEQLRNAPPAKAAPKPSPMPPPPPQPAGGPPPTPRPNGGRQFDEDVATNGDWRAHPPPAKPGVRVARPDEPTRMNSLDPSGFDDLRAAAAQSPDRNGGRSGHDFAHDNELTRPADDFARLRPHIPPGGLPFEDNRDPDEATRLSSVETMAAMDRARRHGLPGPSNEERTRAVNIRDDASISDIDWDLD